MATSLWPRLYYISDKHASSRAAAMINNIVQGTASTSLIGFYSMGIRMDERFSGNNKTYLTLAW